MYKIFRLLIFMLLPLLWACSEDIALQQGATSRQRRMVLDGSFLTYGPDTRASSITFPKDAVMYLQLGDAKTVAVLDGREWMLTLPDGLADDATGVCTAYYFEQAVTSLTSVSLSSASAIYRGTGSFSNSLEALTVSATVRPVLARLHFRGAVGTSITVTGLEGYAAFLPSYYTFTEHVQPLSLTVQADGYTPYVYAMLGEDRTLKVSDGTFTFTRSFDASVMQAGESGFLDIPTQTLHTGWIPSYEQTDVTLDGNDYAGDSDWNQADKEPTKDDLDVSGTDFDDDNNWNQSDKEPTNEVDAGKEDYDGDNDWNQSDPYTTIHEWVDLGIVDDNGKPVYWATCNVGADNPWDCGNYYAWGETTPKTEYNWGTYTLCDGGLKTKLNKYCASSSYGKTDGKRVLEPQDDAATMNWGEGWRMPTYEEFTKLRNECQWTKISNYKNSQVAVFAVQSTKPGFTDKYIILPMSGFYDEDGFDSTEGRYWSSTLYHSYSYYSWSLGIKLTNKRMSPERYMGLTIRPVCQ